MDKERKEYTVLTYIFNDYEKVHEIEYVSDNAEYILVTDDESLSSSTWNIIVDHELDGLSPFDKGYRVRFNPFKYCNTDLCLRIDGSIIVKGNTDSIIDEFNKGNYDMGLMIHPDRNTLLDEYTTWIKVRGYPQDNAVRIMHQLKNLNYDYKGYKGIYQGCLSIQRNDDVTNNINSLTYDLLKYFGKDGKIERLNQTIFSFVINHFYEDKLHILPFNERLITKSDIFQWCQHNSCEPMPCKGNGMGYTITPYLYNKTTFTLPQLDILSDNVDIYIATITDFDEKLYNKNYKIYHCGDKELKYDYSLPVLKENKDNPLTHLNPSICEFTCLYDIYKYQPMKKYVGFTQYRKKIDVDNLDIDSIMEKYDVILGLPARFGSSVYEQYNFSHNKDDMDLMINCCKKLHPEYQKSLAKVIDGTLFYPNNIFIMKKEDFCEMCEFIYSILQEFLKTTKINTYEDCINRVEKNKTKYIKNHKSVPQHADVGYQSRFLAYLIERMINVFIDYKFPMEKRFHTNRFMTQKKYTND